MLWFCPHANRLEDNGEAAAGSIVSIMSAEVPPHGQSHLSFLSSRVVTSVTALNVSPSAMRAASIFPEMEEE